MVIGIKGHPTRGEEVIKLLKTLGGRTKYTFSGEEFQKGVYWYISTIGLINWHIESRAWNVKMFALEEFEKQFPFKVGDKVEILLNILEKNPNFLKQPNETINPHIIYNLQQIVSRELEKREAKNDIYEESEIGKELDALEKEYDSLSKRLAFLNSQKEVKGSLYLDGLKRCKEVDAKYSAL
jgi:hypothetical protein